MDTITEGGRVKLEAELKELQERRVGVIERLKAARELGDLSENAEYTEARDTQGMIDTRIMDIEHILKNAVVTPASDDMSTVGVGNKVKLSTGKDDVEYTIVGSVEADPSAGEISDESPIGRSIMGKGIGDSVEVLLPAGAKTFTIKGISGS